MLDKHHIHRRQQASIKKATTVWLSAANQAANYMCYCIPRVSQRNKWKWMWKQSTEENTLGLHCILYPLWFYCILYPLWFHCILYLFTTYVPVIPLYTDIVFWRPHMYTFSPLGQCLAVNSTDNRDYLHHRKHVLEANLFLLQRRGGWNLVQDAATQPRSEMQLWHSILRVHLKIPLPGVSDFCTSLLNGSWEFRSMSRHKTTNWIRSHNANSSLRKVAHCNNKKTSLRHELPYCAQLFCLTFFSDFLR